MGRVFHPKEGPWTRFAPMGLQAAASAPTKIDRQTFGRVEVCVGRLGAGKTTWAAVRAKRLARATGRELFTTGECWPDPWHSPPGEYVGEVDEKMHPAPPHREFQFAPPVDVWNWLFRVRDAVVLLDEVHLLAPSSRGLLTQDVERSLVRWMSLLRKRRVCVVGTTQAWTRVATHYRQLVTCVWVCEPIQRGRLHRATPFDVPEDGGQQVWAPQFFHPVKAAIPTRAGVWMPYEVMGEGDEVVLGAGAAQGNGKVRQHRPDPEPLQVDAPTSVEVVSTVEAWPTPIAG